MSLIEGIGDEVTHFFLCLFAVVLVSIAWWSTNITDQRQFRTVVLLDRRRRRPIIRRIPPRRVIGQTQVSSIQGVDLPRSTLQVVVTEDNSASTSETNLELETSSAAIQPSQLDSHKAAEPSTSTEGGNIPSEESNERSESEHPFNQSLDSIADSEVDSIIQTMDADTSDVQIRLRKLARHDNQRNRNSSEEDINSECSLPHSSGSNLSDSESKDNKDEVNYRTGANSSAGIHKDTENSTGLTIKLKYINDDVRVVDGKSEELLGDFKKRHFQEEEATNKVVKLIFNGHVLRQDNQPLKSCGFFDNCVVHCLVHPKRGTENQQQQSNGSGNDVPNTEYFRERLDGMSNFNNNNQGIDWDLGNFLFALISFILLAAWYFRYVYAHLYTVTATIGLILITGIFTIVLIGMCFPDNYENVPIPTIRIARTERINVQGQSPASQS